MSRVFLSYAHKDAARVRVIARALENLGHDVFWDVRLRTSGNWRAELHERLLATDCVIVAWSPHAGRSRYVEIECEETLRLGRALIPVILEEAALPNAYADIQAADLTRWIGNVLDPEWHKVRDLVASREGAAAAAPGTGENPFEAEKKRETARTQVPSSQPAAPEAEPPVSKTAALLEEQMRTALTLSPVQQDAFQDLTTIRVAGEEAFEAQISALARQGYKVVDQRPGEAVLERRKRFNWTVAVLLTLLLVFPLLIYLFIYPFLPKVSRLYVVQVE